MISPMPICDKLFFLSLSVSLSFCIAKCLVYILNSPFISAYIMQFRSLFSLCLLVDVSSEKVNCLRNYGRRQSCFQIKDAQRGFFSATSLTVSLIFP